MIRLVLYGLLILGLFACASQPKQPLVADTPKPKPQQREQPKIPDRPLKFGEEFVFSVDNPVVRADSLEEAVIDNTEECLISQTPTEEAAFDNISDFVEQTMKHKWIKPRNINKQYQCDVALHFSASGCVTEIEITGCKDNIQLVRSIESALFRSAPFPAIGGALAGDRFQFEFFAGP